MKQTCSRKTMFQGIQWKSTSNQANRGEVINKAVAET
jgi:hypothetical protein